MKCPDCDDLERRRFLRTVAVATAGLAATAAVPNLGSIAGAIASSGMKPVPGTPQSRNSEDLVAALYKSLSPQQKGTVAFPFEHSLRSQVHNNWHITPATIGKFFSPDQQEMIRQIFRNLHNPEFVDKVFYHLAEDGGGIENYSVALFGEPGSGAFQFVLTGRHCTVRCDGDSVEGAAFGGPIFYGHASQSFRESPDHPKNIYWYQAQRANEVFRALDPKQQNLALLGDPRRENAAATVQLRKPGQPIPGLPVSEMTRDQRELVEKVLTDLLLPFRERDRDEALNYIRASGGVEAVSVSFYKNRDLGNDGIWDVWQIESPTMVWYFREFPHVHAWANLRARA